MSTDPVLLVEDSADDVLLLRRAFHKASVERPLHVARDGDAAVAYLSGAPPYDDRAEHPLPSLVLLDLKLPRRDGFEVLAWVRAQAEFRLLPVVVFTSSSNSPDVERAYALGANSYLVKPVSSDELLRVVRSLEEHWFTFGCRPAREKAR